MAARDGRPLGKGNARGRLKKLKDAWEVKRNFLEEGEGTPLPCCCLERNRNIWS